ncbi:Maf family nucleotide pyrophosphatase [Croceitalea rosinachiae]|uniref:dTTP/UTP pyrophosphatase n=1 Tax=Croceitalea rosinachiae TaxID=3075596 RepID=A0ABU3AAZ8_9FLAO|nr:Maf family nucleotide pyrophosphatase [Croceitalea sp. F388]MDT0607339.1 Maf family nucleotide pyrophosphatase [Croceitalea sp. F388]
MIENPLRKKLKNHKIVLASGSPRRKQFFEDLGLDFEIRLKPVEEIYPETLKANKISENLAVLKASPFKGTLQTNEILVTSDTVVWHNDESLAKAGNNSEATDMLKKLSDGWHDVITSVCFTTPNIQKTISMTTKVKFGKITEEEINYYIEKCKPFDKAGAYGIQEWLGAIAIESIQGSYNNVVGMPTHLVYKTLMNMVD